MSRAAEANQSCAVWEYWDDCARVRPCLRLGCTEELLHVLPGLHQDGNEEGGPSLFSLLCCTTRERV